eukprot:TRINITY_DN19784_c0_g1_i1.p1 TRINITY_DN19784_c0_g1~~TRINITY_DN19784_c0_g1_i1.p1  ORF type:complete len:115 (-),score=60.03 TRINITY_DN19784_c0_g1_i1:58-402(-)
MCIRDSINAEYGKEQVEVKEVVLQKSEPISSSATVDAQTIKAKRELMLAKIEELKRRKVEVGKKKVVDEAAVVEASKKEKEASKAVSYTHLRAHETVLDLVCRLLLEKKKKTKT